MGKVKVSANTEQGRRFREDLVKREPSEKYMFGSSTLVVLVNRKRPHPSAMSMKAL